MFGFGCACHASAFTLLLGGLLLAGLFTIDARMRAAMAASRTASRR